MTTATDHDATAASGPPESNPWKLYFAGFMGGLLLAIGDLATNDKAATVLKFQAALKALDLPGVQNAGFVGLCVIGFLGALFCWIWPVASRGDAFVRGFSVFAILSVGTPYKIAKDQLPVQRPAELPAQKLQSRTFSLISEAHAQDTRHEQTPSILPNAVPATVTIVHTGVSSCKPRYWGIFGIGSFINNTLEICETGHTLPIGTKVEILDCWDTGFRSYRYVKISYTWEGGRKIGWAITGQAPAYWSYIVPETSALSRLPAGCRTPTN